MRWFWFKFWFIYRLILACLTHTNWILAIYVNCAYFVFWKCYDLLWFWMHCILCICFVPLRSENYLLVWCTLIYSRFMKYPGRKFKVNASSISRSMYRYGGFFLIKTDNNVLKPDFSNSLDVKTEKERLRMEKRERRELAKRIRERKRLVLLAAAKREAKNLSSSIELLLQLLRIITSFAILVGNLRKTFLPASIRYVRSGDDESRVMYYFRWTIFLDVFLFWSSVLWAYCLQWHLCCRLGLYKFWLWTMTLVCIGVFLMIVPMMKMQSDLDSSWCRLQPNSTFAKFPLIW
ncbi:unnamed protein product [Enterobius vermicularis]|uniref:1-acylglycerol-3-phosphate O-acyltransferase n=1 Tax=Enterobius vermicularis TaxID=51028 RepID=A0A0N4VAC8_ENTVE|nr:unnamed protein product [Enterobius vermicularis]